MTIFKLTVLYLEPADTPTPDSDPPSSQIAQSTPKSTAKRLQIRRIAERFLVAAGEAHIRAVQAEVRFMRIAIRIARFDGSGCQTAGPKVIGIVSCPRTFNRVVVC